ncbi:Calx-beta domain-containing protein [Oceanicaulis sp. LC35]|uniref:Calx-beta domain-containing protein n=1 Tax=Oceanicaulis sp. LC35 TaxID=3349635 RepID=UPI003F84A1D3
MTTDPDCVPRPEIEVTGDGWNIADGDSSPRALDHTDFGSVDVSGVQTFRTFTVTNSGTGTLTLGSNAASLSGPAAADYVITSQPATSLAPGGTTTVVIRFDPSAAGTRSATLTIANNDSDESPFNFAIQGTGVVPPSVTLSVSTISASEGDGSVVLTATQSSATVQATTVNLSYSGTASGSGVDFTGPASITIPANATSQTAQISFVDDTVDEDDETIIVDIASVSGGNSAIEDGVQQQTITLTDNDAAPTISIADAEDTEGSGALDFVVSLNAASTRTVTVVYATSNWTASAGTDYTAATGTVTFNPGETSKSVSVTLIDDGVVESDEWVTVMLSSPTNATIADSSATGTILDDDQHSDVTLSVSTISASEGDGSVVLTATKSSATSEATIVNLSYSGTANGSGIDYTGPASITIPANATSQTAQISFVDDAADESDETIHVDIASVTGGNGATEDGVQQVTITLTDNDAAPTISVADDEELEANGALDFVVTLSAASTQAILVDYATSNWTASSGTDYTAASGTLTFAPGQTSKSIPVTLLDDGVVERDEWVTLTLSSPTNATIADSSARGTITNDDTATLSIADVQNQEGAGLTFTLTLSAPVDTDIRYKASTTDGTAIAGDDYTALGSGSLRTISAGDQTVSLPVTIADDGLPEADETFTVTLFDLDPASRDVTLGDASATGTILNDDQYPDVTLSASPTTLAENGGTSTLTATLSAIWSQDVTVALAYSNANATGPASIVVPAGDLTATGTVTAVDNAIDEPDRTVEVSVDSVTNGVEDGVQAVTLTLTDDEGAPSLSIADVSLNEGASGTKAMTFTATLSTASAQTVTVDYATSSGTATANVDFDTATGTLNFAPGQTQQTFDVTINSENRVELDETFTVTLSSPTNATIADATATGTILNDDAATISIADGQRLEGDASDNSLNLLVSMSAPVDVSISLTATTSDGTATAPADYHAVSAASYSISDGQMGRFIPVSTKADTEFEPDETFTLTLADLDASGRAVTFSDATATVTIRNDDAAPEVTLSASPTTIAENAGTSTLTATLSATSTEDVTVTLAYSNANATGPASIVVPAGDLTATATVTAVDNAIDEPDRTIEVSVDSVTNGTENGVQAVTLTLTDDEGAPSLSIADVSLSEGASGTSTMTFTVSLSATSGQTVTVDYATSDGTATAGADYTAASGTLTFTPGQTQQTFDVTVSGDNVVELTETFTVTLSSANNAAISDASATGTITNDDSATLSIANSGVFETEADQPVSLIATLSAPVDTSISFEASTADGTATAPSDYDAMVDRSWSINTGQTTVSVLVNVKGDAAFEPNETFTVTMANLAASGRDVTFADTSGTVSILNNDSAPNVTLSASPTTISENAGTSTLTATLSATSTEDVTVSLAYSNANATGPASIVVPAGDLTATATVTAVDNTVDEPDRTIEVSVNSVTNGTENGVQAVTLTLTDDEGAPSLSIADVSINEGASGTSTLTFTVTLSTASAQTVTVDYATSDGTATAGADYTAASGTLTFTPAQTQQSFDVTVSGDAVVEASETITATLSSAANAVIGDASATGTITNDDAASLSISDVTQAEGDAGTTAFDFTVSLSNPIDTLISVDAATADDSATTADGDYTANTQTLTFAAGAVSQTFTIHVAGDTDFESDEAFLAQLSNLQAGGRNVSIADASGRGVVQNDDGSPPPSLSVADVAINESDAVATIRVTLDAPSAAPVSFNWSTADNSAIAPGDYSAVTNRAETIPAGTTRLDLSVPITDDAEEEPSETFTVTLSGLSGAIAADSEAVVTINANDIAVPDVTLSTSAPDPVSGPFEVVVDFTRPVTGLELADFTLVNASAVELTGSGERYTLVVQPSGDGAVSVELPQASAYGSTGHSNTASNTITRQADGTAPELVIMLPGAETMGEFSVDFAFSETVMGFELSDISVTNGTASDFEGSGANYSVLVTPTTVGSVGIEVGAGAGADEAGNATLAATASIEASPSANGVTLVLAPGLGDPGLEVDSSTLTNPGAEPLAFLASADVSWLDITPVSGTVPPFGSLDLTVALNELAENLEPGEYVATITVASGSRGPVNSTSGDGSSSHNGTLVDIPVSLNVEARFGDVTLIVTTPAGASGNASFGIASDIAAFDGLTLTTSGGSASVSTADLLSGTYAIVQSLPVGWRTESMSCAGDLDGGSSFDAEAGTLQLDLDANESLVCTIENVRDEDAVRLATQRAIRGFLARRADRIVEAAPDLSRRFSERDSTRRGAFGANVDGSGRYQMNLAGSLAGARGAAAAATPDIAGVTNYERPVLDGWDVWFAAEVSGVTDNRAGEGASSDFGIAQLGVDYQLSDTLILGVLAQYDWMQETAETIFEDAGAIAGARLEGEGWMAGPYAVWRIRDSLTLDATALYGRSSNRVDPLGVYEDEFDTGRYMIRANLTGEFASGAWRMRPKAGLVHFEERQDGYVDSLGITIPDQTVSLGRLHAGPELAWRHVGTSGGWLELTTAVNAVWDYQPAELFNEAGLLTGGNDDLRADARFGLATQTPWGALIRLETGFDGIGIGDFEARSGRFEIRIPFGAAGSGGGAATGFGSTRFDAGECDDLAGNGYAFAAGVAQDCASHMYGASTGAGLARQ